MARPTKYSQVMIEKMNKYVDQCVQDKVLPIMEEFAYLNNLDQDTLTNWGKIHKRFFGSIKRLKAVQSSMLQRGIFEDGKRATGGIFLLKNNHGFRDKTETDLTTNGKDLPTPITSINTDVKK